MALSMILFQQTYVVTVHLNMAFDGYQNAVNEKLAVLPNQDVPFNDSSINYQKISKHIFKNISNI